MMIYRILISVILISQILTGQNIYRYGTTTANFLEIGVGSAYSAMGDMGVTYTKGGPASAYWNPASLAFNNRIQNSFMIQPWILDINMMYAGTSIFINGVGTIGLSLTNMSYGEMDVTTMEQQDGTGEKFSSNEFSASLTFSRKIVQWFAFGASAKLINSKIWHSNASAFALDLGVIVNTEFFSPTGDQEQGMKIGMSISNYGSRFQYDGIDLLNPIDIAPNEDGNFSDVPGQFRTQLWELPLLFRIGVGLMPLYNSFNKLTLGIDAVHSNNNAEYLNIGGEYELSLPGKGSLFFRSGYKSLFLDDSEFGLTYGGGVKINIINNQVIQMDYSFKSIGILGDIKSYTVSFNF
ncbi:MAG: PorV/PorQ family protein [Candidatus Marinimicrobia bacterium]|nr:PorV/PorQ family protein [Candidatus Neomarinimicrobiota bacterium]